MAMHPGEVTLTLDIVRELVGEQFPLWRDVPIEPVPTLGTVNAIFRIGDGLAARFPLVSDDPDHLRTSLDVEADALRELAVVATVTTPRPVAIGGPGADYPMPWSVQTWVSGVDATVEDPAQSLEFAADVAAFIAGLRRAHTRGRRFAGHGRGGDLRDHDDWLDVCFSSSQGLMDVAHVRTIWASLRTLPRTDEDCMCHGDLTPPNILVADGRLVGILDGGGFGPADPALDLVAAWHLFDAEAREIVRTALGCSDTQWLRGIAWAFQQAMGLVWYYRESNPEMSRWGQRTLDRIVSSSEV